MILLLLFSTFFMYLFADTECPLVTSIQDRRPNKNTLRLVQYNVEWLFIDYYSGANCPGSGCPWHSIDDAYIHLAYVADAINILQPDIINLCEVEGCDELDILIRETDYNYRPYLKKGTDTSTGQNVGLLTKLDPVISLYRTEDRVAYPIVGSKCGTTTASGTSGVSKHYITEFSLNYMKVALIAAHLLAIPTDPSRCVQREAQSQVLQNVINSYITKGYEVIMLGDMNDYDAEILDINSDKPTSRVLDILKGLEGEKKGSYNLTNIAYRINKDLRFSDWWDSDNNCNTNSIRDYSMIDHILVTPNLDKKIANAFIYQGYEEYCGKWNSDHYPVVIDFMV